MTGRRTLPKRAMPLIGVLCIGVGYWAPWVAHRAAGLSQNAFDLSEFAKFLPQVRDGSQPLLRWLLLLPLSTTPLSLRLVRNDLWPSGWGRLGVLFDGVSLLMLLILVPPYPFTLRRLMGAEFLSRTMLSVASWAAYLLVAWRGHRLSDGTASVLVAALSAVGTVAPVAQFLSLRDALSAVYGEPVTIGWGVWVIIAGALIAVAGELRSRHGSEEPT